MKTRFRILISVLSSIAVSMAIALIAFSILKGMNTELRRSRVYGDILEKTHALNILTASFKEGSGQSDIRQVRTILLSLDNLLKGLSSRAPREEALIRQLQKNNQELGPLIDQVFVSGQEMVSGLERERRHILASQIWMKVRFISDDTNRLMDISQSRMIAAQEKAGAMIIVLIIILALTNGGIYFFSGRGILRAQEALRQAHEHLARAQQSAGAGIWDWDMTTDKLEWSPELFRLFGLNPAEDQASFETWRPILHPEDREPAERRIRKAVQNHVRLENEYRIVLASGEERWISAWGDTVYGADGRPLCMSGICVDITEHKRDQEQLRTTLESIGDGFFACDADWRFVYVNAPAERILGIRREDVLGKSHWEVFPLTLGTNLEKEYRRAASGEMRDFENFFEPWGRWFHNRCSPRKGGGISVYFEDITERKGLEEKLKKSHEELELRVAERTAELQETMKKLKESNQALQDFASIASHDLQEPLRKVKTFGRMLKQKCGDSLGDQGNDYLERVLNANERMQSLLTALLEYSRLSTRAHPFVEVALTKTVHEVLSDLEVRIEKTGGEVRGGELPAIQADPTQMRQLFQNLIGNGLKFHKEGQGPVVDVSSTTVDNRMIRIVVEDNGIGFDEQSLDKIFAPFQRLHGRSSPYEGTGMGLAICKKIVERHGGSITAESIPGKGATFIVTLPFDSSRGSTKESMG